MPLLRIKLFAGLRDAAGTEQFEWDAPAGTTAADLRAELVRRFPQTAALAARSFVAADREYAVDSNVLDDAREIAFLPPVSGG